MEEFRASVSGIALYKLCIIGNFHFYIPCTELPQVPLCPFAGRYMEIIRIHCLMRGNDNNSIRFQFPNPFSYFMISVDGIHNFLFFTLSKNGSFL